MPRWWYSLAARDSQYDWRLPPHQLEIRDGYFTYLKNHIQMMRVTNSSPVVLLGHSMGNRVIQYFLNWVVDSDRTNGRKWIDENSGVSLWLPQHGTGMALLCLTHACVVRSSPHVHRCRRTLAGSGQGCARPHHRREVWDGRLPQ